MFRKDENMEQNLLILGAGKYKVIINGATGNSTASSVTVSVGDKKLQKEIPSQGDWETYSEVDAGELELTAGKQTLRLTIDNDYINVDWIKFTDVAASISSSATAPVSSGSNAELRAPVPQIRRQVHRKLHPLRRILRSARVQALSAVKSST